MSYTSINELPEAVRKALSPEDCVKWMATYNDAQDSNIEVPADYPAPEMFYREVAWSTTKYMDSSRFAEVVVTTEVVDKEGEIADVDAYYTEGLNYVNEGGLVMQDHGNKPLGSVWKVYKGVDQLTGKPCLIACLNFFRGKIVYDRAWTNFRHGKTQWSIGSIVTKERECDTFRCYSRIKPVQWFELSSVIAGINPRTYVVDYNDSAKSLPEGVLDMHDEVCPIMQKYNAFKDALKGCDGVSANIIDGGIVLVHGKGIDRAKGIIEEQYSDYNMYSVAKGDDEDDEECILLIPHPINDTKQMLDSMIALIDDEKEAINGYITVIESLEMGNYLDTPDLVKVKAVFNEIIHDEEEHIGGILEAIKLINPEIGGSISEGMEEAQEEVEETEKGCPAGQHEHAGIAGCHDVFRDHSMDMSSFGTDALDLTNENIDIQQIKNIPTDKLRLLVVKVAKSLLRYSDGQRQEFLSSTPGKEFVLMFLELKRRMHEESTDMTEKDAGCKGETEEKMPEEVIKSEEQPDVPIEPTPADEAEKGSPPDILSSIANIASTLASITSVVDQMNIRMMKIEESIANQSENKTDLSSAIMGGDSGMGDLLSGATQETVTSDVQSVSKEDTGVPSDNAVSAGEEKTSDNPFAKEESSDAPEEKKDDAESEDSKEEPKDESKDDSKEESKDDAKDESKDDEKKDDTKDDEKKPPFEKKKGEEVETVATEEVAPTDAVPTDNVVTPTEVEPVADVPTEPVADVPAEPVAEPVADAPVEQPVVSETTVGEEAPLMPPGGGTDFKSAWAKRQAELRAKGVELNLSTDGYTSMSAVSPGAESLTSGIKVVQPSSRIGVHDGVIGSERTGIRDFMLGNIGSDPRNFLDRFKKGTI